MTDALAQLAADVAERLITDARGKRRGDEITARCRFHEEKHASFRFNTAKGAFVCFGCGERGGVVKLARALGIGARRGRRRLNAESAVSSRRRTIAEILADLRTERAERDQHRATYEAIGLGSLDPAFAHAVTAYASADLRCATLEAELSQQQTAADRKFAAAVVGGLA